MLNSTCVSVDSINTPFDYFCFESTDSSSVILNYAALKNVLSIDSVEGVVKKVALFVNMHMAKQQKTNFTIHLFCTGMVIRNMTQHRQFMQYFAKMFKETFPTELTACYVYNAPSFFSSLYELLRPILPKSSRDKIILTKSSNPQKSTVTSNVLCDNNKNTILTSVHPA